jgi:hypothetical protein
LDEEDEVSAAADKKLKEFMDKGQQLLDETTNAAMNLTWTKIPVVYKRL